MEVKEINPRHIYRTPLKQTMQRPTDEAPDIDVTGIFVHPDLADFWEHIEEKIPDPVLRCDFLDLWFEYTALFEYMFWAIDAGRAAIARGDDKNEKFYEDLVNTVLVDYFVVFDEYWPIYEEAVGEDPGTRPFETYRTQPFMFKDQEGVLFGFGHLIGFRDSDGTATPAPAPPTESSNDDDSTHSGNSQHSPQGSIQPPSHTQISQVSAVNQIRDASYHHEQASAPPPPQSKARNCCIIL